MSSTSPVTGLSGITIYTPPTPVYSQTEIDTKLGAVATQIAAKANESDLNLLSSNVQSIQTSLGSWTQACSKTGTASKTRPWGALFRRAS